jgi:Skp family chaperone for outer membrane proteins
LHKYVIHGRNYERKRSFLCNKYLYFVLWQQSAVATAGGGREDSELQRRLSEMQKELEANHTELEKTREDANRSQVEMERLLQLVQMSQEEQNAKEKTIRDLQE